MARAESKCSRSREVEAAKDGRLDAATRALAERHVVECSSCAREARELDELSARLRSFLEVAADDFSVHRLKRRVTRAVDRDRFVGSSPLSPGFWLALVAVTCAGVVAVAVAWRSGHGPELSDPAVDVTADSAARWAMRSVRDVKRLDVESGKLRIQIARHPGDRVVVVHLPDGEIDDTGTTFSVTVVAERTRRVAVDQGSVLLRLRDQEERQLGAGQTWERPESVLPIEVAVSAQVPAADSSSPADTPGPGAPSRQAPHRPAARPLAASPSASSAGSEDEDEEYLRVLKLLRAGDVTSARTVAKSYLRDFPSGFRAPELRRLLENPTPPATAGSAH
jgi:TolA-binding protein